MWNVEHYLQTSSNLPILKKGGHTGCRMLNKVNLFSSCQYYSGPQQLKMGIPILVEPTFLQSASRGGSQLTTL